MEAVQPTHLVAVKDLANFVRENVILHELGTLSLAFPYTPVKIQSY